MRLSSVFSGGSEEGGLDIVHESINSSQRISKEYFYGLLEDLCVVVEIITLHHGSYNDSAIKASLVGEPRFIIRIRWKLGNKTF